MRVKILAPSWIKDGAICCLCADKQCKKAIICNIFCKFICRKDYANRQFKGMKLINFGGLTLTMHNDMMKEIILFG